MRTQHSLLTAGVALLWALVLHLVLSRFLIADSVFNFLLRFVAVYLLVRRGPGRDAPLFWIGLFLVPAVALAINDDFLFILSRTAVLSFVLMLVSKHGARRSWSETIEALLLAAWGFWLCHVLVDPGSVYAGWFKDRVHLDYVPLISEDGQNYIELGQNLIKLVTTMYRPPGFPLLTRFVLAGLAPNLHLLLVCNVLVLMTSVHLLLRFAYPKASWWRVIFFIPLAVYLNATRAGSYQSIVTDPLNDLLMIGHLIFLYRYLIDEDLNALRRCYLLLLAAFFVRPTILYYSFAISLFLLGRALWRKQGTQPLVRNFGLLILLPVLILVTRNRLIHGVYAYSSMQGQVLAYRTYGTMEAIRRNLPDVQSTFAKTAEELASWRRLAPRPSHPISGEGEMVYFDNFYATKQILSDLPLFLKAWTTGAERLLFHDQSWTDDL